jgi:hypothetical protein
MDKRGIIEYSEPKNIGHKLITKIIRTCPELAKFVPEFKLRRTKQSAQTQSPQEGGEFPKVMVTEVFALGKHLARI